jgi:hypothetical protein
VLTNNGSGILHSNAALAVGQMPWCVIAADINGDSKMDLVSADSMAFKLTVFTNNGSGGFAVASSLSVGYGPAAVAAADLNADGTIDLVSANYFSQTLSVLLNEPPYRANFSGNGSAITGLNASELGSGTVPLARLPGEVVTNYEGGVVLSNLTLYGNVGIGTNSPGQQLCVMGRIRMGNWTADGTTAVYKNASGDFGLQSSDLRLKKNVQTISNALEVVAGLRGVTFNWLTEPEGTPRTVGLVAQEVRAALPELTFEFQGADGQTYLGVHYEKVAAVLVNAVQQQQAEIESLSARLEKLERMLAAPTPAR